MRQSLVSETLWKCIKHLQTQEHLNVICRMRGHDIQISVSKNIYIAFARNQTGRRDPECLGLWLEHCFL